MTEIEEIVANLRTAAASRDDDAVEMWIGQLDLCHDEVQWPSELYEHVKGLLADAQVLSIGTSWHLAKFVSASWDEITEEQRQGLAPIWPVVFDRFADWMGAFVIAEILGERYANDDAFRELDQLSRTARMPHRALAAYGLGCLGRTVDGPLRERATARLRELAKDSEADVSEEASEALRKLDTRRA